MFKLHTFGAMVSFGNVLFFDQTTFSTDHVTIWVLNHFVDVLWFQTIPDGVKYLCLLFVGTLNAAAFNSVCKTYYLLKNKNNVGTIYIDQRLPCSGVPHHDRGSALNQGAEPRHSRKISKNERLHKWYNKLYDMEALSVKEMFSAMLEKEAQIYPLLVLCQFIESIPKLIVFGLMTDWTMARHHGFVVAKLVMAAISFVAQMKSCFVSCGNAEFIEQFNDE